MSNASQTPEPGTERSLRSTARNPRRRQRQSDGDSLKTTAPKRKRSKLSEDAFTARETTEVETLSVNGSANDYGSHRQKDSVPGVIDGSADLPMRGKKSSIKRMLKGDGATVLTQNPTYTVKQLPSTPRELRRDGLEYRGCLGTGGTHLALAVTSDHAFVWDYSAHTAISSARVFDMPFLVKPGDPLPFGALVVNGASTDLGLLLVSATTPWKVVFYESIERAASIGLFQKRKTGVEGVVGGLFAGETVADITSADHAGFILTLSSGRVAQLTLRDGQGKARIWTQILRASEGGAGGLFGSIKGLLGTNWKRATAVRTRALGTRGQMQVVALTEKAELLVWDLDWSGRNEFKSNIDFRELVVSELRNLEAPETQGRADTTVAIDFALVDNAPIGRGNEIITLGAEQPLELWVLLRSGSAGSQKYAVLEMNLTGDAVNVSRAMDLESYRSNAHSDSKVKPRILLPKPGHTGYVTFADAVTTFSPTIIEPDGPDAQLHVGSYIAPVTFQDTVYLRSDKDVTIFGADAEESRNNKDVSCIAFFKGTGLVRFNAIDPAGDVERSIIPVKSKIEQAVFYGHLQENVLDFTQKGDNPYSLEEVEAAALAISHEILTAESPFILVPPTAVESHLSFRARALRALVTHVAQSYPALSRSAMWRLLWDAEKLAAGQEMSKAFEEQRAITSRGSTGLYELCSYAKDKPGHFGFMNGRTGADLVNSLFIHGLDHLATFLPLVREILGEMSKEPVDDHSEQLVKIIAELNDVWVRTLKAILSFRADNAIAYGTVPELIQDGILVDSAEYADLPEFWTSSEAMIKAIVKTIEISRLFAADNFSGQSPESLIGKCFESMTLHVAELVKLWCLIYQERINWLGSRTSPKKLEQATRLEADFVQRRHDEFKGLVSVGQSKAAIKLAERYRDMHILTELNVGESQWFLEMQEGSQSPAEKEACAAELEIVIDRIGRYFEKFGDEWANAFFDEAFSSSRAGHMLHESQQKWGPALTRYLRADKSRAKLCWIDDIISSKDFRHATASLVDAATERETQLWAKKVELSMSKLALMAAKEAGDGYAANAMVATKAQRHLEIVEIQERIYTHIYPEVLHALDREMEVVVAMEKFGTRTTEPSLKQLLSHGIQRIINHEALEIEELVDVLTLMDSVVYYEDEQESNLQGGEIYCALQALNAAGPDMDGATFEILLALIWKRCYIQDDWTIMNIRRATTTSTRSKKTRSAVSDPEPTEADYEDALRKTNTFRTIFAVYDTGLLELHDCNIRVMMPTEVLGAACKPEHLSYRFLDDALLDPILQDNKQQDELLKTWVTDLKMDQWVLTCEDMARRNMLEKAERVADRWEIEREVFAESGVQEDEGVEEEERGGVNGHANGDYFGDVNGRIKLEEEDLVME